MKFSLPSLLILLTITPNAVCTNTFDTSKAEADLITHLPGQTSNQKFDQYSGYVRVNYDQDPKGFDIRDLFYYFTTAQTDDTTTRMEADERPLVLWLNGGPGCSSLGGGLSELGPYFASAPNQNLTINSNSWNKKANMVFLESPAGVGFSTSTNEEDYKTVGDERTARDTLHFLLGFMKRFPRYKSNDLWISGESYAGKMLFPFFLK